MQKELDVTALQNYAKEDPDVNAFFAFLANEKRRHRDYNDIRNLVRAFHKAGLKLSKEKLLGILQRLQELGAGRLVMGRGRTPNRFYWDMHRVSIGKAAHGVAIDTQQVVTSEEEAIDTGNGSDSIVIRRGEVTVEVPANADDKTLETVVRILDKLEAVH